MEILKETITTIKLHEYDLEELKETFNNAISYLIDYEDSMKVADADYLANLRECYQSFIDLCDDLGILDNPKVIKGDKIVLGVE